LKKSERPKKPDRKSYDRYAAKQRAIAGRKREREEAAAAELARIMADPFLSLMIGFELQEGEVMPTNRNEFRAVND